MQVQQLEMTDYRNYETLHLPLLPGVTVLSGHNAQGKTNIVEALQLCATGRSHRTRRDKELIRWGAKSASVAVDLSRRDGAHRLEIRLFSDARKQALVDHVPVGRLVEMLGEFNAVLFSPEDLGLVKDGPAFRRRFLDMEISQMRPAYCYALQQYQRALLQRNQMLKNWAQQPEWHAMLPEWDAQLCRAGAAVIAGRQDAMQRLSQLAGQIHVELTGGWLQVEYQSSVALEPGMDRAQIEQNLLDKLTNGLSRDILRGGTGAGPHRDDISLTLGGVDLRTYGSQGQQRTAALCLKLAEMELLKEETGEMPVLLLDDVMSELDENRRTMLLNRTLGAQTIITCTNAEALPPFDQAPAVYWVEEAKVSRRA